MALSRISGRLPSLALSLSLSFSHSDTSRDSQLLLLEGLQDGEEQEPLLLIRRSLMGYQEGKVIEQQKTSEMVAVSLST